MRKRLDLIFHEGVAKDVRAVVMAFVARLSRVVTVKHRVPIHIVRGVVVQHSGVNGFALFTCGRGKPQIYAAGIPLPRSEMTRAEALTVLKQNIAHEVAHYEQFRDGKKLTERGVESRAMALMAMAARVRT